MCSISYKRLLCRRFFDLGHLFHLNQGSAVLEEHGGIWQEIRNLCRIVLLSMEFENQRQILIAGYMQDQTIKDPIWEVSV